jgi:pre-mRNA-processing factor 39
MRALDRITYQCIMPLAQETDPDNFENWEKLVRTCESLEGGLNRNSSPQALATLRDSYDRFLLKFPLLFGYWKKYADLEFNISGPESAEMVCLLACHQFHPHNG